MEAAKSFCGAMNCSPNGIPLIRPTRACVAIFNFNVVINDF